VKGAVTALLVALAPVSAVAEPLRALTLRQDVLGWEGVGRIAFGYDGYCTGVLIAPDIVLTAAHCLFDDGVPRRRETVTFRAGERAGDAIAERRIVQAVIPESYRHDDTDPARRIAADVALLRLDLPIPSGTARPFQVDRAISGGTVSVVSYGAGRDTVPSRQSACNVLGRQDAIVALDCDVTFGSSGAPVFRSDGSAVRIVSIVAAGGSEDGRSLAFGPVLDGRIAELTERLRAGAGVWQDAPPTARRIGPGSERPAGSARFVRP
jgi:protease YdgD